VQGAAGRSVGRVAGGGAAVDAEDGICVAEGIERVREAIFGTRVWGALSGQRMARSMARGPIGPLC